MYALYSFSKEFLENSVVFYIFTFFFFTFFQVSCSLRATCIYKNV